MVGQQLSDRATRDAWIVREYRRGRTMSAVGRDLGLSKMRVSQILARHAPRETRRPRRLFAPSRRQVTRPVVLTPLAEEILARTAERTGAGASNVVEYVVRLHAVELTAGEFADVA